MKALNSSIYHDFRSCKPLNKSIWLLFVDDDDFHGFSVILPILESERAILNAMYLAWNLCSGEKSSREWKINTHKFFRKF